MSNARFPLIINGVKFQVNPTNISVTKPVLKGELNTQGGKRFQIWYNLPEVLKINGIAGGDTAYRELSFLKQNFERTVSTAISYLFYKTKIYRGFVDSVTVGHTIQTHERWPYEVIFQLIQGEQFNVQDFTLQPSGLVGEATGILEEVINAPIARADVALGQTYGKLF